ncbi:hypothetical protein FG386_003468 [Cryptosporidium ryanae]|uniref:uncharacterized protein n=1 Tax=Cryptosporidium ryanae TaxID=515981 RepID=UPI00351AAD21|nr:hypothetical protein FG386_003468 [Cryptosporidium ryanae]
MKRILSCRRRIFNLFKGKECKLTNKNVKEEEADFGKKGIEEHANLDNLNTSVKVNENQNIKDDSPERGKDYAADEEVSGDKYYTESDINENECELGSYNHIRNDHFVKNRDEESDLNGNLIPLMFSLSNKVSQESIHELKANLRDQSMVEIDNEKIENYIAVTIENMIKLLEMLKVVVENETPTVSSLEETQLEYNNRQKITQYFGSVGNDTLKKVDYIEKITKNVILNIKEMISGELLLGANSAKQELLYSLELLSKLYIESGEKSISDSILGLINDINNDKDIMILAFKINQVKLALKYFNILNRFQEFNYGYLYSNHNNNHYCYQSNNNGFNVNTSNNRSERLSASSNNVFLLKNKILNKVSRWHKQSSFEKLNLNGCILEREDHRNNEIGNGTAENSASGHGNHSLIHNLIHHNHHHHSCGNRGANKSNHTSLSENQQKTHSLSQINAGDNVILSANDAFGVDKNGFATGTTADLTETVNNEEWNVENSKGISISYKIDSMQNGQMSINFIIRSDIKCKLIYLISILNEVELSHMWAPYMTSSKCIYNLSRVSKLVQQIYELPWPIGQRENIMYCFGIDALKEKDCVIISCGDPQTLDGTFFGIEIPEPPPKIQREKCNYLLFILTPSIENRELITVEMYSSFYVSKYVPAKLTTFLIKRMTRKMYTDIANLASNFSNTEFETAYNNNIQLYSWLEKKLSQFYDSRQKKEY